MLIKRSKKFINKANQKKKKLTIKLLKYNKNRIIKNKKFKQRIHF